jgi:hypothetical protein
VFDRIGHVGMAWSERMRPDAGLEVPDKRGRLGAGRGRSRPSRLPGRPSSAVVLGASGSVITDALGPYEVFARSPTFSVYTVSASRPTAMLSGGLAVVPDYSLEDVDAGLAPEPDVVVVPAVAAPNGRKEAPLREWITRRSDRGAHLLGVCNGSRSGGCGRRAVVVMVPVSAARDWTLTSDTVRITMPIVV